MASAFAELETAGFIHIDAELPADQILNQLTLEQLAGLFPRFQTIRGKQQRILAIVASLPDLECRRRVRCRQSWLVRRQDRLLRTLLLLFFGDPQKDLSTLVMQDLGILRYEQVALGKQARLFNSNRELTDYLGLWEMGARIHNLKRSWHSELAWTLKQSLEGKWQHRALKRLRDRRLYQLGRAAERVGESQFALDCYSLCEMAAAAERRARILYSTGDQDGCRHCLEDILAHFPASSEVFFARSFARRKKIDLEDGGALWQPPSEKCLTLESPPVGKLERTVAEHLEKTGSKVWFLENHFSLGLFGLAFWDVVFAPIDGMFVNAYQTRPLDLYWPDFTPQRQNLITASFARFNQPGELQAEILRNWRRKQGIANALVHWQALSSALIQAVFRHIPAQELLEVLKFLMQALEHRRRGFPDLLVLHADGGYEYLEVKAPGDRLSLQQRSWFELFRCRNIPAAVLKVTW